MRKLRLRRSWLGALCAAPMALALGSAPAAQGAASDPLFVITPAPQTAYATSTTGYLSGPCGIAVDSNSRFYVSDYYHHSVEIFNPTLTHAGQLANEDPKDGPCGLAFDASNHLYVNNYHHNVVKFGAYSSFGAGSVFPLPAEDTAHHLPTGVAVDSTTGNAYVDNRTYVSVYDSTGAPVEEGGQPLKIGLSTLGEGYGVAVSRFPATFGRLYVPDASTNTVKVYDPAVSKTTPVAEIKDPFGKPFTSLRDSTVAVDQETGWVYFADDLQPTYTEQPQAEIYAYDATGLYRGHLKHNVINARPLGIGIDNSGPASPSNGRVYVTSGNADKASIYVYERGGTTFAAPLPPLGSGLAVPGGSSSSADPSSAASSSSSSNPPQAPRPGGSAKASASVITQSENLRVSVSGKLSPKKLPRRGTAPISVSVGWEIATTDGSPPPKLKTLQIEINRNGRFDSEGLPTCPYAKIQPATTQRALSSCRSALVGQGSFSANIALKGQEGESYPAQGRLLVFNGEEKGKPVLFGQIYAAHPFATSFVITFKVKQASKGTYGTVLAAQLPKALRSWGDLTGIQMSLSRRYHYEGESHSYISAGCPAPKGFGGASFKLARTSFAFTGGKELASTVVGDCRAG